MKNTLKTVPTIVISSVIILLTLLSFFLGVLSPRETLDWLGLVFVLISEMVLCSFLLYIFSTSVNSSKRIFQTGVVSILTVYWIISVLLALFRDKFVDNNNYFTILNILLIVIVAIISMLLNSAASRVQISNSETTNARLFMQDVAKNLFALKTDPVYSEYRSELSLVYEKAQFTDIIGKSSYDSQLSNEVDNLKVILNSNAEDTKMKVEKSISQILFFIKQHNVELSKGKRGGF